MTTIADNELPAHVTFVGPIGPPGRREIIPKQD